MIIRLFEEYVICVR